MEKYVEMKSLFTGGRVKEVATMEEKEFRKEKFLVHVRYYMCEDTGEQFTTTEQDTLQFNDLYAQYRTRHGIPFPDEIRDIRKHYGLNYSQISRLLGFGINQYAKYENGEVPSESNGKMIAAIKDKQVLLKLLNECSGIFTEQEYEKILSSIKMSDATEDKYSSLYRVIFTDSTRSIYNGFGYKSIAKLFDMVRYIVFHHQEVFPTKLNKLMYYADFIHYRNTGISISGLKYRALNFGPVPEHYATIYDNVPGLEKKLVEAHEMVSTLLSCQSGGNWPNLSEQEKSTIDCVLRKLRTLSVSEIINASHEESGWREAFGSHLPISYDTAFALKLIKM